MKIQVILLFTVLGDLIHASLRQSSELEVIDCGSLQQPSLAINWAPVFVVLHRGDNFSMDFILPKIEVFSQKLDCHFTWLNISLNEVQSFLKPWLKQTHLQSIVIHTGKGIYAFKISITDRTLSFERTN